MSVAVYADRGALQAGQLARLSALLKACAQSNAFYAPRIRAAGLNTEAPSLAEFCERMEFTCKQELVADQAKRGPYGTNLTYPVEDYSRYSQTSATTGAPLRWLDTDEGWSWMMDSWQEVYLAVGVDTADRILFTFSFGPFIGFWLAFETATRMGCLSIPGGGLSSVARLRLILDNEVTVVCCTPTYALRLAEVARQEGIDLAGASVHTLIVAGEPGGSVPATRARIEASWPGAQVMDHHGMTEVGPVSYACPSRSGVLHVIESAYLAEVVDPQSGQAIAPGQTGELVLTTLGRFGSPLLRYRTGDLVKPATERPCACGRYELALEGGILGRADDMRVVRGVNVFPSAVEEVVRGFEQVAEFRVEVHQDESMTELALQIEPCQGASAPDRLAHDVEARLREVFSLRMAVSAVAPGTLPRFEMKAKRWINV